MSNQVSPGAREDTTAWTPEYDAESATDGWAPGGLQNQVRRCQHCGGHVSAEFRRVHGDGRGAVFGCPSCCSMAELHRGAYREGEDGASHVDLGEDSDAV